MTMDIGGYEITGIKSVLISVAFIFGVRLLNLLKFDRISFPLFVFFLICVTNPFEVRFKPRSFPDLQVSISLLFTLIVCVLS